MASKDRFSSIFKILYPLRTHVLSIPDISSLENSVDPDQLALEEAFWSGAALFSVKNQLICIYIVFNAVFIELLQLNWKTKLIYSAGKGSSMLGGVSGAMGSSD